MSIKDRLDALGDEAEEAKDLPYDTSATPRRPNIEGSRVVSVRFRRDEYDALMARADAEGLPVSTMARLLVTRHLRDGELEEALRAVIKPEFLREAS